MTTLTIPADAVRTARRHCSERCFAYHGERDWPAWTHGHITLDDPGS